jgi:hypothetical protein
MHHSEILDCLSKRYSSMTKRFNEVAAVLNDGSCLMIHPSLERLNQGITLMHDVQQSENPHAELIVDDLGYAFGVWYCHFKTIEMKYIQRR